MKLWVGILFLVVSAQLGINARPIPRPMGQEPMDHGDESIHHHGSFGEERDVDEEDGDIYDDFSFEHPPFQFQPIYKETTHQEYEAPENSIHSREKQLGTDNQRVDEDDKNGSPFETHPEEQEHGFDNYSETDGDENEPEFVGRESIKKGKRMVENGENDYTDTTDREDEKEHGMTEDITDKKPDTSIVDSLKTQLEEQERLTHSTRETEQNGESNNYHEEKEGSINSGHDDKLESVRQPEEQGGNTEEQIDAERSDAKLESVRQPEEQDGNTENQFETGHNGIEFEFTGHYGSLRNGVRWVGEGEDGLSDSTHSKGEEDDLKTLREERENTIVDNTETDHDEYEFESFGRYQGSLREARGMVEEDEDYHDEFEFENYVRPIYAGSTNLKVEEPDMDPRADNKRERKSSETQPVEQEGNVGAEHSGMESEFVGHYESVRNGKHTVEDGEDFDTGEDLDEKHPTMDNKKVDVLGTPHTEHENGNGLAEDSEDVHVDTTRREDENSLSVDDQKEDGDIMDKPDTPNANSLEPQPQQREDNVVKSSETERNGDEHESIDRYHESARKARIVVEQDENVLDKLPFEDYHFYGPEIIYMGGQFLKVEGPNHFVPIERRVDKKKSGTDADQDGIHRQRRDSRESFENTGPGGEARSRKINTPQGTKNYINEDDQILFEDIHNFGDTYNNVIGLATRDRVTERDVSQENDEGDWNEDMKPKYTDKRVQDESIAFGRGTEGNDLRGVLGNDQIMSHHHENYLVSHDEDNLQEDSKTYDWHKDVGYNFQASGDQDEFVEPENGPEKTEALDLPEDDKDQFQTSGGDLEETKDSESEFEDGDGYRFHTSGDIVRATEASDWQYGDEDEMETSGGDLEEAVDSESERDEDNGYDFPNSGDKARETKASDWQYGDEDEVETSGRDLEEAGDSDLEPDGDDGYDIRTSGDNPQETEALDWQYGDEDEMGTSGGDLEEAVASDSESDEDNGYDVITSDDNSLEAEDSDWKYGDEEELKTSGGDMEIAEASGLDEAEEEGVQTPISGNDANDRVDLDNKFVDDVANSGLATQLGLKNAKGLEEGHILDTFYFDKNE